MPTIHYSARSTRLSVRLSKWVCPKITCGQSNFTKGASPPKTGGWVVFARWRYVSSHEGTLAPPGEYDWSCAFFGPSESTTQTANRSVQPFLHSSRQKVPILYDGRPYPPELPLPAGRSGPPSNTWFLGPMRAHNQMNTTVPSICGGDAAFRQIALTCCFSLVSLWLWGIGSWRLVLWSAEPTWIRRCIFGQYLTKVKRSKPQLKGHCVPEKWTTKLISVTLSNLNRFSKFFHC